LCLQFDSIIGGLCLDSCANDEVIRICAESRCVVSLSLAAVLLPCCATLPKNENEKIKNSLLPCTSRLVRLMFWGLGFFSSSFSFENSSRTVTGGLAVRWASLKQYRRRCRCRLPPLHRLGVGEGMRARGRGRGGSDQKASPNKCLIKRYTRCDERTKSKSGGKSMFITTATHDGGRRNVAGA